MQRKILSEDVERVANALRPLCMALEGHRIFLTGGTGFFGKWLLHSFLRMRQLFDVEVSLTVLSRDPRRFLADCPEFSGRPGLDFFAGDVRSFEQPVGRTFDFVIHGATAASVKLERNDPCEMFSVITEGTRHILEFTRRCDAKRLLFISSGAVYGPQPPSLSHIPETYAGLPETAYGKGKKASEQLCLEAVGDHFECVIVRPFAFVGPYLPLDAHFAVGNFIRDALSGCPITLQGDGRPLRSYLHAADLAVWLWTILLSGKTGQAYNVGSPAAVSIAQLAHLVSSLSPTHPDVVIKGLPDERVPAPRYVPDTRLAERSLGLQVSIPLEVALRRTLEFHQFDSAAH